MLIVLCLPYLRLLVHVSYRDLPVLFYMFCDDVSIFRARSGGDTVTAGASATSVPP